MYSLQFALDFMCVTCYNYYVIKLLGEEKMKNKLKTLLALLLVAVMALSFVACDIETGTDDENDITFSIDVAEQMNDKWKMTYKECQIKNKLDSFITAEEGTEFVVVFFEIENISDESQNFSIIWEEFYIDGVKTAQTLYGVSINNAFPLTTVPVEPGRKANGYFLFQTSPDWKELEIIYDESLANENEENVIKFTLTKNAE